MYEDNTDVQIEGVNTHRWNEIFVEFGCKWTQGLLTVNRARSYSLVYEWAATGRRHVEWRRTR